MQVCLNTDGDGFTSSDRAPTSVEWRVQLGGGCELVLPNQGFGCLDSPPGTSNGVMTN